MKATRNVFDIVGGAAALIALLLFVSMLGGNLPLRGSFAYFGLGCSGYVFGYLGSLAIHIIFSALRNGVKSALASVWEFVANDCWYWIPLNIVMLLVVFAYILAVVIGPIAGDPPKIVLVGILIGNIAFSELTLALFEKK